VVRMEDSKQMMDKLRELASKELKNREAQEALEAQEAKVLEAPAVEAIFAEAFLRVLPATLPRDMNRVPQRPPRNPNTGGPPGRVKRR
jgi:hypothetical protein